MTAQTQSLTCLSIRVHRALSISVAEAGPLLCADARKHGDYCYRKLAFQD